MGKRIKSEKKGGKNQSSLKNIHPCPTHVYNLSNFNFSGELLPLHTPLSLLVRIWRL
jgi:hypothetical protein